MTALIYTDASFFPEHKVGGFAFWIDCGKETIKMSGVLRDVNNSTEAETMAICNALHTFIYDLDPDIKDIIIYTDSLQSIQKINRKTRKGYPYKMAYELLISIKMEHRITNKLESNFQHVKAHSGINTIEKKINRWCDSHARKAGREYVSKVRKTSIKISLDALADKLTFKH
jgi:ribonuclease HI